MYEMYPDWGPAKHDPEHPLHRDRPESRRTATRSATATALRDDDEPRPDDN